jgi:hypothetical protein
MKRRNRPMLNDFLLTFAHSAYWIIPITVLTLTATYIVDRIFGV